MGGCGWALGGFRGRYCVVFPDCMKAFGSTWCVSSGPAPEARVCAGRWLWPTSGGSDGCQSWPCPELSAVWCLLPQSAVFARPARSPPWALWSTSPWPGSPERFLPPSLVPKQPRPRSLGWDFLHACSCLSAVSPTMSLSSRLVFCAAWGPSHAGFYLCVSARVNGGCWRGPIGQPCCPLSRAGPSRWAFSFVMGRVCFLCLPAWSFKRNF